MKEKFLEYIRVQRRYSARTVELYRSAIEGFCSFACPEAEGEFSEVQLKEILKPTLIRGYTYAYGYLSLQH